MSSPLSLGDVFLIVEKAVSIYKKIKDAPEEIEKVGKRMERLRNYLRNLDELLNDQSRHGLAALRPTQVQELKSIVKDIKIDSGKVHGILFEWHNQIGPGGFVLRFKFVANALFALGSSPAELASLTSEIERHSDDINRYIVLLLAHGQNQLLNAPHQAKGGKSRSPSPSSPLRNDYNIIFIDSDNDGRSKVGEAYAGLVQEWTQMAGATWRIKLAHSAGLLVQNKSDTVTSTLLQGQRLTLSSGNQSPNRTAMEALFENQLFKYPFKKTVREKVMSTTSRGLRQNLFTAYDYIFVFNRMDQARLLGFREALVNRVGQHMATAKGKGKIKLLGEYGPGNAAEIWNPRKNPDGSDNRDNWNKTVARMKISFKNFLSKELGWVKPT